MSGKGISMKRFVFPALFALCILFPWIGTAKPSLPEATKLFGWAQEAYWGKDLDRASRLVKLALKREPDNSLFRFFLGQVLFDKGDFHGAKESFDIVSESLPSSDKGNEYVAQVSELRKSIKRDTAKNGIFQKEGRKMLVSPREWRIDFAIRLSRAFKLDPELVWANQGDLKGAMDILEEARETSERAGRWPKELILELGNLYEKSRQWDKAKDLYIRALEHADDWNEEFILTHRFDQACLRRRCCDMGLDPDDSGVSEGMETPVGSTPPQVSEGEAKFVEELISSTREKLENAGTEEERESILDAVKTTIIEKQKSGELPGGSK